MAYSWIKVIVFHYSKIPGFPNKMKHFSNQNKLISSSPSNLDTSANTFFYDHNEVEWINGPSLMKARSSHAVGIVTDLVTNEQLVTVTGGLSCGVLPSTEILQDGEWVQGKIYKSILHISQIFLD